MSSITVDNVSELSMLCYEFGFAELSHKISEFQAEQSTIGRDSSDFVAQQHSYLHQEVAHLAQELMQSDVAILRQENSSQAAQISHLAEENQWFLKANGQVCEEQAKVQ
jgi:hypothetical protein